MAKTTSTKKKPNIQKGKNTLARTSTRKKLIFSIINTNLQSIKIYKTKKERNIVFKHLKDLVSIDTLEIRDFYKNEDIEKYKKKNFNTAIVIKPTDITTPPNKEEKKENEQCNENNNKNNNDEDASHKDPGTVIVKKVFKSPPMTVSTMSATLSPVKELGNDDLKIRVASRSVQSKIYRFVSGEEFDVITFDVLTTKREPETIWTHNPTAWEQTFSLDLEDKKSNLIRNEEDFMHLFQKTEHRLSPGGSNTIYTHTTSNGKVIQKWILYRLIDSIMTDDDIKKEFLIFNKLSSEDIIRRMYSQFASEYNSFDSFNQQINPSNGSYWNVIQAVTLYTSILHKSYLAEVFMDNRINDIVNKVFGTTDVTDNLFTPEMIKFARG
jgi:hypothetical protein